MTNSRFALALTGVLLVLAGCDGPDTGNALKKINGSVHVTAGMAPQAAETVNVAGGIKTVAGDIAIHGASHVEGGILIEKTTQLIHFGSGVPRIEIGPGATVQGDLRFEREVKLYVSDKATIGPVTGAIPIPFSGDTAPAG
jgi:hypothetical protein